MTKQTGRPPKYPIILEKVRHIDGWAVINTNQKNRTAPSGMRKRYPFWDFKTEPNDFGKFNLLARHIGDS